MNRPAAACNAGLLALLAIIPVVHAADATDRQPAADGDEPVRVLLQPPAKIQSSPINDRFALRGGYYQPSIEMPLRYDASPTDPGTTISAEDTLGMDDVLNQGAMEMMIRLTPRQRLRVNYLKIDRTGDVVLDEAVDFGDDTFLPGDRVESSMDLRLLELTYNYSIFRHERWELALGLGLHLLEAKGEAEVTARFVGDEFSVSGAFPSLAIDATYLITERFSLNARAQYLGGNVGDTDGSYANYHADVQFRAWPNLAFGLGYTSYLLRVDSAEDDFSGRFVLKARGPEAFVRVSF
jgi:hypothetical protein